MQLRCVVNEHIIIFITTQQQTHFNPNKITFGIELSERGIGDNNGTMDGHKYFECPKNRGLFVLEKHIKFKIKPRKKHHRKTSSSTKTYNIDNIYSDKSSTLKSKSSKIISLKKLGPRDIGRNENYGNHQKPTKAKGKKRRKKSKKSKINKANKNIKFKEKPIANPKSIKIPRRYHNDTTTKTEAYEEKEESDSFKSGYNGHSDFEQMPIDDAHFKNTSNVKHPPKSKKNTAQYDEYEEEDVGDENNLTRKVMKMMKLKEEQKRIEEQQMDEKQDEDHKIVIVPVRKRDEINSPSLKLFAFSSYREDDSDSNIIDDDAYGDDDVSISDEYEEFGRSPSTHSEQSKYVYKRYFVH